MSEKQTQQLLGKLLNYVAEIAVCARLYTGYNSSNLDDKNAPYMAMFFTDMLHNLDSLGNAVIADDHHAVSEAVINLQSMWKSNEKQIKSIKTKISCPASFNSKVGIDILEDINQAFKKRSEKTVV